MYFFSVIIINKFIQILVLKNILEKPLFKFSLPFNHYRFEHVYFVFNKYFPLYDFSIFIFIRENKNVLLLLKVIIEF